MKNKILSIATLMLLMSILQTSMAQSYYIEDDIYYTPGDKNPVVEEARLEKEVITITATPASQSTQATLSNYSQERDVDEYNRRYGYASYEAPVAEEGTQIDNTFVYTSDDVAAGDTLYIQMEDGYYLNGFNGSHSDYEYTVQIHRFYNPRYTVSISDPAYSTIYMLDSNDWNVYIDGSYAWVTPTWTNPWYWSYTWSPYSYSSWAWRTWSYYGWYSPWYDPWYYPGYYHGWYDPYYHHHHHHHYGYYDPYHHHHHHHAPYYSHNGRGPARDNNHGRPGGYYDGNRRPHNDSDRYGGTYDATSKKNDRRSIVSNRGNKVVVNGDNTKNLTPNRVSDRPANNRTNNLKVEGNRATTTINTNNRTTVTNNRSNVSTSRPASNSGNRGSSVNTSRSSSSSRSSVSPSRASSNSSRSSSVSPSRSSSSSRSSSATTGGSRGGGSRGGGNRR